MGLATSGLPVGGAESSWSRAAGLAAILLVLAALGSACAPRSLVAPPSPGAYGQSYQVFGRTYRTLVNADGYVEEGLASWYGDEFHGRLTSSGETYDMHALTAAHKTLPLNCWVKVSNLANGREVVVRVNDRGPFVDGRIVDLSLAAARALGMEEPGVVPCRVEALGYRTAGGGWRRPKSFDAGEFAIQVGAFRDPSNARRLRDSLATWGRATICLFERGDATFYRVRVSRYGSLTEALRHQDEIRRQGFADAFVVAADQAR